MQNQLPARRHRLAGAVAALGFALSLQSALAQNLSFDIPAQPLPAALAAFAGQAGLQLAFPPELVQGKQGQRVAGQRELRTALNELLAGTGLQGHVQGKTLVVQRLAASSASTLPSVTVSAAAERSATTEGSDSFAVRAVSIAKGDQALKDIPQSISVMTRKQLDEQGIVDMRVAANSVTGVVAANGNGQGMTLTARGFGIGTWLYDGVAIPRDMWSLGNWGTEDMVFFDRMEVLRGASGLLQGTGSPGGSVNLVRKRGQPEKTVAITARAGSWDRYGLQLDAGGPLNQDGSLRGRVVLDEARSHSFVDQVHNRTHKAYGALDYDIGADTTVGIAVGHSDSAGRPMIYGLPINAAGSDMGLPRSTYTGARWNRAGIAQTSVYADLSHRFNADWTLKVSALRMREKASSTHQRLHGVTAANGSGLTYANWITDFDSDTVGLDAFVNGRFEALGLRHELTLGSSYAKYKTNDMFARSFTAGGNVFAIDHDRAEPTVASLLAAGGRQYLSAYDVEQKGVYARLRTRLTEPLTAIVGVRASWYDNLYTDRASGSETPQRASGEITPYAGLVYALTPQWSLYGSYSGVFEPQSERTAQGTVLEPVTGVNLEAGIKGELLDGRVNASLAVFRYDHKNRAVTDMASGMQCDGWYCAQATGKVRSQGVEAEVSGEVLPRLQLTAGYTYNTTEYLSDPELQGQVYSTWTPSHMLRTWASYRLPGDWNSVTVGAGFTTQSHTQSHTFSSNKFRVPGYTVANLRLGWQATREVQLAVNVNNLFDKRYWLPGFVGYSGFDFGDPRNVMFTLKYTPRL
ncbi:TonB-dependent siderophore receptor [Pseudorhodoferax sp. Leaf265]|uniref:TonB-dependent siderophore receptor n=1 Tax=Pseudorhodoferax sp. Leaf265 TaxID=1736315 RepID=UPI0006FE2C64|nr:TonB-dependent siderophore receptor [Pseudorhodoferax sp. Leaf265]KQP19462.1 ligand-gated channel protein [Pseudorhodoferax sp. Leaf265]